MLDDFLEKYFGHALISLIVAMIALIIFAVVQVSDAKQRYMRECQADGHKRYECEAMWRSGDDNVRVCRCQS